MAWQNVSPTAADRMVDALELYRKSGRTVRECVQAEILGLDTPEAYDRLERIAIKMVIGRGNRGCLTKQTAPSK